MIETMEILISDKPMVTWKMIIEMMQNNLLFAAVIITALIIIMICIIKIIVSLISNGIWTANVIIDYISEKTKKKGIKNYGKHSNHPR